MTHADTALTEHLPGLSADLAAYAADFNLADVPPDVQSRAAHLMLDALGIGLASTGYDYAHRTFAAMQELAGGALAQDPAGVPVIGMAAKLPMRDAAIVNAVMIHGLDYDDTHPSGVIHATASVLPAALSVGAAHDASGADVLGAYILGAEIAIRIASAARGGFHQVGFHPTGLIGAFGCTFAAGHLMKLNAHQLRDAQGIVLSMASGSLEFLQDGAWTKRLHPGWAAHAGITAATLAKHGFVGTRAAYEGRFGLFASHLGELNAKTDLSLVTAGLGEVWETLNVAVKPIPACHFVHACADASGALHAEIGQTEIISVVAKVPEGTMKIVCEPDDKKKRPANAYEAQFSIPYAVATGLLKGRFSLDALEESAYTDAATLALARRVTCEADPQAEFPRFYSGDVTVELADGRTLHHREHINRGAPGRPITDDDVRIKFHENAARAVPRDRAQAIEHAVLGIASGRTRDLMRLLGERAT
jgi:2-methylcitrate dehydratase PrpD